MIWGLPRWPSILRRIELSLHVQLADEAVPIGPAPAAESYLNMARIIRAAHDTSSEAIHPGYGFLAENADFARLCEKEGIVFIGPNSGALALVGDKVRARQTMEKAGIPIIPGMKAIPKSVTEFEAAARSHRISGDRQGFGRRRRKRDAHRLRGKGPEAGSRGGDAGSQVRFRR